MIKKSTESLSFEDKIRHFSSGFLPTIAYRGENYKDIPLPLAIAVCIIASAMFAILAGFVFVAIVILTSN